MGDVGRAVLANLPPRVPDPTTLRAALTVLAATALVWLDTLPDKPHNDTSHTDHDDYDDVSPF